MIEAAIVGLGCVGTHHHGASWPQSSVIRPVLGVDGERAGAQRAAAEAEGLATTASFEGGRSHASDIGAVILCSPHKHHAAQIVAAAKAGKHVFCEKPLCTSARRGWRPVVQAVTVGRRAS